MSPVAELLNEIRTALAGFVDLLQEETAALSGRDPDRLSEISARKARQAETLNRHWAQLARGLSPASLRPDALTAILNQQNDRAALQAWGEIRLLAEEADRLNRHNGLIIQEQLQHTTRALEVLKSMARENNTYGPDGLSAGDFAFGRSIDKA